MIFLAILILFVMWNSITSRLDIILENQATILSKLRRIDNNVDDLLK